MGDPQNVVWDDETKAAPAAAPSSASRVQWSDATANAKPAAPAQGGADVPQSLFNLRRMGQTAMQTIAHPIDAIQNANEVYNAPAGKDESVAAGIGKSLGRTATMVPNIGVGVVNDVKGGHVPLVHSAIVEPAKQEYAKAKSEAEQGHVLSSMGHSVAAAIPLVGPMAANIGERLGTGTKSDIAGGITDAITVAAAPKLGEALSEGAAPGGVLRRNVTSPATPVPEGAPALPTAATGIRAVARGGAPLIEAATDPLATLKKAGKWAADKVSSNFKDYGLTPDQQRAEYLTKSSKGVDGLQNKVDTLQKQYDNAKATSSGYVHPDLENALQDAKDALHDKVTERERIDPKKNAEVEQHEATARSISDAPEDTSKPNIAETPKSKVPAKTVKQSQALAPDAAVQRQGSALADIGAKQPSSAGVRATELDQLADRAKTASPEELQELDRMGAAKHDELVSNLSKAAKGAERFKAEPQTTKTATPNIAESAEAQPTAAATPNIGEASGLKRVGRAGESKAAKANAAVSDAEGNLKAQHGGGVDSSAKDAGTSLGQFAKANGPRLDAAVGTDSLEAQHLADRLHSITNRELGQVADKLKIDIGGKEVGRKGITRAEVFNKMLDAGHSPEDIAAAHGKIGAPPSVSGGSQGEGPRVQGGLQEGESTVSPRQFLDKVAPGQSLKYKLELDKQTGKPIPDIGKLIDDYKKGGDKIPAIEINYDADGNLTGGDGIKRAMAAEQAGLDRVRIKVNRRSK